MHSTKSHQESMYDSFEDFKAAFICTTNSFYSFIESYDELMRGNIELLADQLFILLI
jgi:hypothetical protein